MLTKTPAKLADETKPEKVAVSRPNFREAVVEIRGTAPYVSNKMSQRAREAMEEAQRQGSQQRRKTRKKDPKDFDAAYRGAMHVSREGWPGIPASAFRAAMISACRTVDFAMTRAKLFIFIVADGYDSEDGQPLVRINGEPHPFNMVVRIQQTTDVACRPMFDDWSAKVHVRWDADQLTATDIVNLLARAGVHCGIGAGRPDSKESAGMGWGTFEIVG